MSTLLSFCLRNAKTIPCPNCSVVTNTHSSLLTYNNMILQQRQLFFYFEGQHLRKLHEAESNSFFQALAGGD
jgi:hypothetical protein